MEEFVVMRYQNGDGKHFSSFFFFLFTQDSVIGSTFNPLGKGNPLL